MEKCLFSPVRPQAKQGGTAGENLRVTLEGWRAAPPSTVLLAESPWMNFMECGSLDHLMSLSMCEPLRKEMACFDLKLKLTMWPRMTLNF